MSDSKNDIAWTKLFEKYQILSTIDKEGSYVINASAIKEFREARLMTKFDYKSQLPSIFSDNNLSILPITRGDYVISTFNAYKVFDTELVGVKQVPFPEFIESIDYKNITGESIALNCAFVTGMITDFSGDEQLCPTVSGRMSSQSFNFTIDSLKSPLSVSVNNAQIEIDGGYEGLNTLCLFEAKNVLSDDFLIRQLYYPYRLWQNKISKDVKTIFLTYSNGIFHLREYLFDEPTHYNSIKLIKQQKYAIRESVINLETIQSLLHSTSVVDEPRVAFPQANSFERVVNLCELIVYSQILSKDDITDNYAFDERQTNYYTDAARYLGIVDKKIENNQVLYYLTDKGIKLFNLTIAERQLEFVRLILSHLAFRKTLEFYFEKGEQPSNDQIINIMKMSNLYNVEADSTFKRRASSITGWINWILNLIEE